MLRKRISSASRALVSLRAPTGPAPLLSRRKMMNTTSNDKSDMKRILYFSIAALAVAGCAKELQNTEAENGTKVLNTYTVSASVIDTKVNLDDALEVLWQSEDRIGLVDAAGNITPATLAESSVGLTSGTFTYEAESEIEIAYAYYPYTETEGVCDQSMEGTTLKISLPASQNMSMNGRRICKNNLIMAGKPDAEGNILFTNACAIIRVKLSGTENYARRVFVQTPDRKISGAGTVDLAAAAPVFQTSAVDEVKDVASSASLDQRTVVVVVNPWDGADNRLHVNEEGVTATMEGVDPDVYFVVPAGEYTNLCVETLGNTDPSATAAETSVNLSHTSSKTIALNAGKIRTLNACLANPAAVAFTDRANCFLIENTDGGTYSFTTVTGGTNYADGKQKITAKSGFYASLLWEDARGLVTNVRTDNVGRKIFFTVAEGLKGNAVIALRTRNGKIAWSWHVWVAGTTVEERTVAGVVFMDRNLGATAAAVVGTSADAAGCHYEWGRKDPFPGIADFNATGSVNSREVYPDIVRTVTSQNGQAITWATALPYVYIWGSGSGSGAEDWCNATPQDGNQWGNAGSTKPKTIYDPCPFGYRVGTAGNFTEVVNRAKLVERANFSVTIKDDNDKDFVFPCCGYWRRATNSTEMCNAGTHCWIWTMTSSSTNDVLNTSYQGAAVFNTTSKASSVNRKTPRRWGANVRCVKFDESAVAAE